MESEVSERINWGNMMNRATENRNDEGRGQKSLKELERKKRGKQLQKGFYESFVSGVF